VFLSSVFLKILNSVNVMLELLRICFFMIDKTKTSVYQIPYRLSYRYRRRNILLDFHYFQASTAARSKEVEPPLSGTREKTTCVLSPHGGYAIVEQCVKPQYMYILSTCGFFTCEYLQDSRSQTAQEKKHYFPLGISSDIFSFCFLL
jgi:hypothetical protein